MESKVLIGALVTHFVADFILQSRKMGKEKSSKFTVLLHHLAIQAVGFLWLGWKFALLNAAIHGVVDWHIWRLYKLLVINRTKEADGAHPLWDEYIRDNKTHVKEWKFWDDHWFYTTIGFDQLLHIGTIVFLLDYLK